jgi:uncharacterized membrane protein YagU involved in acid resistance
MDRVTTYLYEREPAEARRSEDEARGDRTAYAVAAEKAADLAGVELSDEKRHSAGLALHWLLGASAGSVYGLLRSRVPGIDAAKGLAYGTAFWAIVDEGANVLFGFTPGPRAFPWHAHARGLVGHLVYGAAAEGVLTTLDRSAGGRRGQR